MFAALFVLPLVGTPLGSPNPPVCTASRGFFKVGIAELPRDGTGVLSAKTGFTVGASGCGVSLFAVAGFAIGDVNTGDMIRGFGCSTGTGCTTFASTGCFTGAG